MTNPKQMYMGCNNFFNVLILFCSFLFALVFGTNASLAETAQCSEYQSLSLEDCLSLSRQYNPALGGANEKIRSIAVMKLIGATDREIIWLVMEQSLLLTISAFLFGLFLIHKTYSGFPRTILLLPGDDLLTCGFHGRHPRECVRALACIADPACHGLGRTIMEILRIEGLAKIFGSGHLEVRALEDINLSVSQGELAALLGPSGSGKTTMLLCISLILDPTGGKIVFDGETIFEENRWSAVDMRRVRREKIGFVFQSHNLIPFLTARQNVLLPLNLIGIKGEKTERRVTELLEYMEIADRADYLPALLSGGEQQRVSIARALANNAKLILADEPTASLDTARGMRVMELLRKIAKENQSAVIVVTHDERMIAGFDHVYHLKDGRLNN